MSDEKFYREIIEKLRGKSEVIGEGTLFSTGDELVFLTKSGVYRCNLMGGSSQNLGSYLRELRGRKSL